MASATGVSNEESTDLDMSTYKRGKIYWFKFAFSGEPIRAGTKQGNHRGKSEKT